MKTIFKYKQNFFQKFLQFLQQKFIIKVRRELHQYGVWVFFKILTEIFENFINGKRFVRTGLVDSDLWILEMQSGSYQSNGHSGVGYDFGRTKLQKNILFYW